MIKSSKCFYIKIINTMEQRSEAIKKIIFRVNTRVLLLVWMIPHPISRIQKCKDNQYESLIFFAAMPINLPDSTILSIPRIVNLSLIRKLYGSSISVTSSHD